MDTADFQSFSNLLIYFGTYACIFLIISAVFCVYKNLRTLQTTHLPAVDSFPFPALPEADLYLVDLMRHVYSHSDRELRQDVKIEGFLYIKFHRFLLFLTFIMTAVGLMVLIPTYLDGSAVTVYEIDRYSLTHIRTNTRLLWIPLGAVVALSGGLVYSMLRFQGTVVTETNRADKGVTARSVEISRLPEGVDLKKLSELLEAGLTAQFLHPLNDPTPIVHLEVVPDLNLAYSIWLQLKHTLQLRKHYLELDEIDQNPSTYRLSLCHSVPAVDFFNAQIKDLVEKYRAARALQFDSLGVAYITFLSVAHKSFILHHLDRSKISPELNPRQWIVRSAPQPKEIQWQNLNKPKISKQVLMNVMFFVLFFVVLTPFAVQRYIQDALTALGLGTFLQNYMTPLLIYEYQQLVLKRTVQFLIEQEKHPRASSAAISEFHKYFFYSLIYSYLLPLLGIQTLHLAYEYLWKSDQSFDVVLASSIRASGFIFTQVVINHCFLSNGMDLLQHSKYITAVFRSAMAKLPEDKVRAFKAEEFGFGSAYAEAMVVFLLVCTYAVVYPLILPFGLLTFGLRVMST